MVYGFIFKSGKWYQYHPCSFKFLFKMFWQEIPQTFMESMWICVQLYSICQLLSEKSNLCMSNSWCIINQLFIQPQLCAQPLKAYMTKPHTEMIASFYVLYFWHTPNSCWRCYVFGPNLQVFMLVWNAFYLRNLYKSLQSRFSIF